MKKKTQTQLVIGRLAKFIESIYGENAGFSTKEEFADYVMNIYSGKCSIADTSIIDSNYMLRTYLDFPNCRFTKELWEITQGRRQLTICYCCTRTKTFVNRYLINASEQVFTDMNADEIRLLVISEGMPDCKEMVVGYLVQP